jgi:1-deoxy-D-xylulose 5-phosphate reductoisomerase
MRQRGRRRGLPGRRIGFLDIARIVEDVLAQRRPAGSVESLQQVQAADRRPAAGLTRPSGHALTN